MQRTQLLTLIAAAIKIRDKTHGIRFYLSYQDRFLCTPCALLTGPPPGLITQLVISIHYRGLSPTDWNRLEAQAVQVLTKKGLLK